MKLNKFEILSKKECEVICEWLESEKSKFKVSTENGEEYISAYESNLTKDFPFIHSLLEKKINEIVFPSLWNPFFPLKITKSFGCRYTTNTSPSMPFHYDGDDFTVLIYLNKNFKGGGTSFPLLKNVTPVNDVGVGGGVVFSGLNPKSWHGALPITKGTRYTISVRLVRDNIFYKVLNIFRIFLLIPFTFLFNKYPHLYNK